MNGIIQLLVNVLAYIVIGIAILFLVFFIGDITLAVMDPENSPLEIKKKNKKNKEEIEFQNTQEE